MTRLTTFVSFFLSVPGTRVLWITDYFRWFSIKLLDTLFKIVHDVSFVCILNSYRIIFLGCSHLTQSLLKRLFNIDKILEEGRLSTVYGKEGLLDLKLLGTFYCVPSQCEFTWCFFFTLVDYGSTPPTLNKDLYTRTSSYFDFTIFLFLLGSYLHMSWVLLLNRDQTV